MHPPLQLGVELTDLRLGALPLGDVTVHAEPLPLPGPFGPALAHLRVQDRAVPTANAGLDRSQIREWFRLECRELSTSGEARVPVPGRKVQDLLGRGAEHGGEARVRFGHAVVAIEDDDAVVRMLEQQLSPPGFL
jgi:hypothetical protein